MKFQFLPENFSRSENAPPFETRKIRHFEVERIFLENKKTYSDEDGHIVHVGQLSEGDEVTLTFKLDKDYSSGTIKLIAAEHSMDTFYNIFNTLSEQKWDIDRATSTKLHGSVDVQIHSL